jgi:hypothetical protein
MNKTLSTIHDVLRLLVLLATVVLISYLAVFAHYAVKDAVALNTTLTKVNQPGTGVLAEVDKTLLSLKGVLVHVDMAANHEDRQLTTLDAQEKQLFKDIHTTLVSTNTTVSSFAQVGVQATAVLKTTNETLVSVQPHLDALMTQSNTDLVDVHTLLSNPDYPALTRNLVVLSGHAAGMSASGDEMLKDGADKLHQMTHPAKRVGFWANVGGIVMWAHSFVVPPLF